MRLTTALRYSAYFRHRGHAQPCSKWVRTSRAPSEIGRDAVEAVLAARTAPGQIATLIVPADVAWNEGGSVASLPALRKPPMPDSQAVERAAAMLRSGARTAILIAGNGLYGKGLLAAGRIASATGAKLLAPYPITRLQRGAGLPRVDRVQYVLEPGVEQFKEFRQLILVGAQAPWRISRIRERAVFSLRRNVRSTRWRSLAKITLARSTRWRQLCRYAAKIAPWNKRSGRRCLAGRLPCRDWRRRWELCCRRTVSWSTSR